MSEHARLSASSAHRWMNCAGAPRMEAGLPDVDTEYSTEGTAAHTLAAMMLADVRETKSLTAGIRAVDGLIAIQVRRKAGDIVSVPITPEMRNASSEYATLVWETYEALPEPKRLYIEQRVSLEKLAPPEPMFGTADAVIVAPGQLVVIDLKYGAGNVVEVRDNPQLMEYALAAMLDLPRYGSVPWAQTQFRTIIFQPRAAHSDGPAREWAYTYAQLREFGHALMESAKRAHDPNAPLTPGTWCRWCKAAAFCPALLKATEVAAQGEFGVSAMEGEFERTKRETRAMATALDNLRITRPDRLENPIITDVYEVPSTGERITLPVARWTEDPGKIEPGKVYHISPPVIPPGVSLAPVVDASYDVLPPDPDRIPMVQALAVLDKAEMIEGFLSAIRERIRAALAAGDDVPGWKLVAGRAMREWVSEGMLEQWSLRPDSGIEPGELYEKVLRSPAQIEKIVGKKNLPSDLYRKVSKSQKLVRADDPRPALPSSAQKEFAALPPAADSDDKSVAE